MISTELAQILEHMEWADATVWKSVLATPACADDTRIRDLLIHTHAVQWAYLQLWRGEVPTLPSPDDFKDLAAVASWSREYHAALGPLVATFGEARLEQAIEFPWAAALTKRFGVVHPTTIRQSILQIGLHTAYHRGQINARLRELGGEPPLVDFVAWVWMGQPKA
jgi:uncharacterized damage-inducible protein DinB